MLVYRIALIGLSVILFSCAQARTPLRVGWYYLDRDDIPIGMYLAVFNQNSDELKISDLVINDSENGKGFKYKGAPFHIPRGKLVLLPFKRFVTDTGQDLSEDCRLPVSIKVADTNKTFLSVEGLPAAPSVIPPGYECMQK